MPTYNLGKLVMAMFFQLTLKPSYVKEFLYGWSWNRKKDLDLPPQMSVDLIVEYQPADEDSLSDKDASANLLGCGFQTMIWKTRLWGKY